MALKDFDAVNPRTRDKNWKEDIPLAELTKLDQYYPFRIIGGVFTYAQHWIEFTNKAGELKRYPVDCANWSTEDEATSKKGGCPVCELGMRPAVRYMFNVIDRTAQSKGDDDPLRGLDIPPTVMRQVVDLKKLNLVKGDPKSVNHPKFGIDIFLQKQRSKKRGGTEWQVQKGDRSPLEGEERELELIDFEEFYLEPDTDKIRADLKRHGYYNDEKTKTSSKEDSSDDEDEEFDVPKSRKSPKKRKRPEPEPEEDDEEEEEDEEEVAPPKPAKKKRRKRPEPEPEEDDEEEEEDDDEEDDFDFDD